MIRLFGYALGILLLAPAQHLIAQAQVNVPPAEKKNPPATVDSAIDTDLEIATPGASLDSWLTQRADELLDVVGCYLDKKSLKDEVALETKTSKDPIHLIEVRIKLLKTLASHNAPSHCK